MSASAREMPRIKKIQRFRYSVSLFIYSGSSPGKLLPNMEKVIDGLTVYLRTTRAIHPGEELFFTYGEEFFKVVEFRVRPYLTRHSRNQKGTQKAHTTNVLRFIRIDVICRGVHPALKAHLSRPLVHFSGGYGCRPSA